jgi:hypothetical protein
VTAELEARKQELPDDLVPTVEQLTSVLQAVKDTGTAPQQRDGAIQVARQVTAALDVIAAPGTPEAVRRQLTGLVKQVTATADVANRPGTPPEEQRTLMVVLAQSSPVLRAVADRRTPRDLADDLAAALQGVLSQPPQQAGGGGRQGRHSLSEADQTRVTIAAALHAASDPKNGEDQRKGLAQRARGSSSSLGDPTSPEARKKRRELVKQLKKAAADQGLPTEEMGAAAQTCTNAVFKLFPDATFAGNLRSVTPASWTTEGVRDYWKSQEAAHESLNVYAQLRNKKIVATPLAIKGVVPRLADAVSADELYATLGLDTTHCLLAAVRLNQEAGVASGSWVSAGYQI